MFAYKNLVFFNKEGDYLNFKFDENKDRFEGDLLFHENSTDTFKTIGIYTFERVPSFEFESPGDLSLNKFQLFNEYGLFFYRSNYENQPITRIEPINNDPTFYSKWIYGEDFERKFPIGSIIVFNKQILEFTNLTQTYTVVATKKGAIMILSATDNATFESAYYLAINESFTYEDATLSAINAIGVYNYINNLYQDNLSNWNEPSFYDKLYPRKKLNVVNSTKNDGTYTVLDENLTDNKHYEYYTSGYSGSDLVIEIITKTDLPKIYEGGIDIKTGGKMYFSNFVPDILKPGREFKIVGSTLNTNFFSVGPIPTFIENTSPTFYATESHVLFNNRVYECVQAYTQSFDGETFLINPLNTNFWSSQITNVQVEQSTSTEVVSTGQVYLTTDRIYFPYGFTVSNQVTLASAAEKYREDFLAFNIDLYYKDNKLKADLIHPSKYSEVNFYHTQYGPTFSIGSVLQTNERLIRVSEKLNSEINYDYSERNSYKIVFTDLDLYGLKIIINKEVYEEELAPIYSGGVYDVPRTIDRTLRNWLSRYYTELITIGINAEIQFVGSVFSPFNNCIKLTSTYPNVPMNLTDVKVGTTADYYIEHSTVLFNQDSSAGFYGMGSYLTININGEDYDQNTVYLTGSFSSYPDIPSTLQSWVEQHSPFLFNSGILVSSINNLLKFDVKSLNRRLDYTISTGKLSLPGQKDYTITKKVKGNQGPIVASNEVTLSPDSQYSFEEEGFATGMVFAVNNTIYPYDNQEYNVQFLDPQVMNLSYQGPFWGLTSGICNSSAFITLAFNTGFGQTACSPIIGPTGASSSGGPFNSLPGIGAFNTAAFSLTFNPNTYYLNTYDLSTLPGTTGLVDIIYVQLSNSVYAFGDNLVVFDSYLSSYLTTVFLPGNTQSIEVEFNTFNNYLYCLSKNNMFVVDPLLNFIVATMSLTNDAHDLEVNPINGDIYVTYANSPNIDIWDFSNNLVQTLGTSSTNFPPLATSCGKMVFNEFEQDMYITTNANEVLRVNGGGEGNSTNRTIQTTYGVPGLTNSIFYEPVNEAIYAYGSSNLYKIDNGVTYSLSITTQPFDDIIFNNLTNEMNISDSSTQFRALDLSSNSISISTGVSNYGYLALNQFDGDVYLSSLSQNNIIVIRPTSGVVVHTEPLSAGTTKIIYNPERQSVWAIQPSANSIVEIDVELNSSIVINPPIFGNSEDFQYGTLDPNYQARPDMWLKTKEYIRRPRENFEGESTVTYYWRWYNDQVPEMFFYDFSGEQLPITGSYAYVGNKPLSPAILNKLPNKDLTKVAAPEFQQTIFPKISHQLSYIDDEDDIQIEPEPLQTFIGFKSEVEGSIRGVMQLMKQESVSIQFESTNTNNLVLTFDNVIIDDILRGRILINTLSSEVFIGQGLKEGQLIVLYISDITNSTSQYISNNNGIIVRIKSVFSKSMLVDFLNINSDRLANESTVITNFPNLGNTTYLSVRILVIDKEIGRFFVYGQTEEEDIRFKVELGNVGKLIEPDDVFIFKEYDIQEGGIDWTYLNMKRKEMLMMKHLIYPYIGAYKSIINAINFFGYNDLQLNEYYRDINPNSEKFLKLFKVEIPDIFDNTVEGWTESEFVKNNFPNEDFEGQNAFNLTYFITDKEGNNKLTYSVDEVIIKLQGLKYWLKKNIIPLTHKIMDITGKTYFTGGSQILHTSYDVRHVKMRENMTPISFKMNEAYLMPVNSGSTVYNCVLDFYSIIEGVGADKDPTGLIPYARPYNGVEINLPDYYTISIRTYKTYKEWAPFATYTKGDKITYLGILFESVIDDNKIKNPYRYKDSVEWTPGVVYDTANIVKYERDFYVFTGIAFSATASTGTSSATASYVSEIIPLLDSGNWKNITEWREIDYEPVQTIKEFRQIKSSNPDIVRNETNRSFSKFLYDDYSLRNRPEGFTASFEKTLVPFNFTVDSNIDPFIVVEVTSDNGYGLIYTEKKNFEVRGIKDLRQQTRPIDPIGPFEPIKPIY